MKSLLTKPEFRHQTISKHTGKERGRKAGSTFLDGDGIQASAVRNPKP
jgi:hypothetical protein